MLPKHNKGFQPIPYSYEELKLKVVEIKLEWRSSAGHSPAALGALDKVLGVRMTFISFRPRQDYRFNHDH